MAHRSHSRSDQEWITLIQDCRSSGMSDKDWCERHQIPKSTFYHHVRQLKKSACQIQERTCKLPTPIQQVVELSFVEEELQADKSVQTHNDSFVSDEDTSVSVITVHIGSITIDITNKAAEDTIKNTLKWLPHLC